MTDRTRELECVIADLTREAKELRAELEALKRQKPVAYQHRDEVLKLAREAGFVFDGRDWVCAAPVSAFERFAARVAAAEREACAKVCDELVRPSRLSDLARSWMTGTTDCAAAIRARGSHA